MNDNVASHLRKWGLKVVESPGWQQRGRPYSFHPRAVICHHTASGSSSGNFGSEGVVTHGRSGLPGPLCQFLLGRDGTVKVIAGGYANHAGVGGPRAGIPHNMGNTYAFGIEAENNGIGEKWGPKQLNAYYRLCAALLAYMGTKDTSKVFGHKEWTSRKIDPAGINMVDFRKRVGEALKAGPSAPSISVSRAQPHKRNKAVVKLKKALAKRGFFDRDLDDPYFGSHLRVAYSNWQKHLGYTGKDADGYPGKTSLEKLGFIVYK